jgi:hypothetical protein
MDAICFSDGLDGPNIIRPTSAFAITVPNWPPSGINVQRLWATQLGDYEIVNTLARWAEEQGVSKTEHELAYLRCINGSAGVPAFHGLFSLGVPSVHQHRTLSKYKGLNNHIFRMEAGSFYGVGEGVFHSVCTQGVKDKTDTVALSAETQRFAATFAFDTKVSRVQENSGQVVELDTLDGLSERFGLPEHSMNHSSRVYV